MVCFGGEGKVKFSFEIINHMRTAQCEIIFFCDEQILEVAMHKIEASAGSSAIASVLGQGRSDTCLSEYMFSYTLSDTCLSEYMFTYSRSDTCFSQYMFSYTQNDTCLSESMYFFSRMDTCLSEHKFSYTRRDTRLSEYMFSNTGVDDCMTVLAIA